MRPKQKDHPEHIRARSNAAWEMKRSLYGWLEECYRHGMPGPNPYNEATVDDIVGDDDMGGRATYGSGGYADMEDLFDMILAEQADKLTNRIMAGIFPIGTNWAKIALGPHGHSFSALPDNKKVEIEEDEDKIFNTIKASNFHPEINESVNEIVVAGLGAIMPQKTRAGDSKLIQFEYASQAEIAPEKGPASEIWGVYRKVFLTKEMIAWTWPQADVSNLRDEVRESGSGGAKIPKPLALIEAVRFDPDMGKWVYDLIVSKSNALRHTSVAKQKLYSTTYRRNPWVIGRWKQGGKNPHGRSPVMLALANSRTLNATQEMTLQHASMVAGGMFLYNDASTFNPDTADFVPGSFLPVRQTGGPNADIAPLQVGGDPHLAQMKLDEMRGMVRRMMLDESFGDDDRTRRTATEVLYREKLLERDVGTPYNRIVKEMGLPILQRVVDIMTEAGAISPMWGEHDLAVDESGKLERGKPMELDGQEIIVTFTGPLATSQNLVDVHNTTQTLEIGQAYAGPEVMNMALKMDAVMAYIAEKKGVPAHLIRSEDERAQLAQKAEQTASMMMEQQQPQSTGAAGGMAT